MVVCWTSSGRNWGILPQMSLKTTKYISTPSVLCFFLLFLSVSPSFLPLSPSLPHSILPLLLLSFQPQMCVEAVEALSAGKHVSEEDLVLLGQLQDPTQGHSHLFTLIRTFLLPMKTNPVVTLLTLQESEQQKASLEQLFDRAETEHSAEVCCVDTNSQRLY